MVTHNLKTLLRLFFSVALLLLISSADAWAQSHNRKPGSRCLLGPNPNTEGEACAACDAEDKRKMAREQEERNRKAAAERERKDREAAARKAERDRQYNSNKTQKLHLSNPNDSRSGNSGSSSGTQRSTSGTDSPGGYNNNNSSGGLTNPLAPGGSSGSDLSGAIDRGAQMQNQNTQQRSLSYEETRALHEAKRLEYEAKEKERKAKEDAFKSTDAKINYYESEAKKGDTASMFWAGAAYFSRAAMKIKGSELDRDDLEKAAYWYSRAADKGHIEAAFQAGNTLSLFFEKERAALAVEKLEQAAWAGHVKAMEKLCDVNLERTYKYKDRNKDTAVAWLERAAFAGSAFAMRRLAEGLETGRIGNTFFNKDFKDYDRAYTLYCVASQMDDKYNSKDAERSMRTLAGDRKVRMDEAYYNRLISALESKFGLMIVDKCP